MPYDDEEFPSYLKKLMTGKTDKGLLDELAADPGFRVRFIAEIIALPDYEKKLICEVLLDAQIGLESESQRQNGLSESIKALSRGVGITVVAGTVVAVATTAVVLAIPFVIGTLALGGGTALLGEIAGKKVKEASIKEKKLSQILKNIIENVQRNGD